ncbi:MAG TPA: response regulator [Chthoniobacteraceae bacterium]|nr:response regulator [Chthoniobacteraceae bacterium]
MPNDPEKQWVRATANELNNLLQVISNSSHMLETLCGRTAETEKYFSILRSGVERATKVTQMMSDRTGGMAPEPASASARPSEANFPPLKASALTPGLANTGNININNPTGAKELVMIVDDEEFVTILAQRVLTDEGYRVVTAKDGFQAIEIYRKLAEQIALIILDFTMPIMDGADVFAELLLINPKVPVVLSSGFAEQERLRSMLARGLRGFMPKPYTQQKLLTQIRSTLDALNAERTGERRVL